MLHLPPSHERRACLEAGMATLPCVGIIIVVVVVLLCCVYGVVVLLLLLLLLLAWALLLHGRSPEVHRACKTQT